MLTAYICILIAQPFIMGYVAQKHFTRSVPVAVSLSFGRYLRRSCPGAHSLWIEPADAGPVQGECCPILNNSQRCLLRLACHRQSFWVFDVFEKTSMRTSSLLPSPDDTCTTNSDSPSSSPNFVEGCRFARPFHLVVIDARGTVSVTRYGHAGVEQICSGPAKANRLPLMPPPPVTAISSDGVGRSAKITVEAERATMQ